MIENSKNIPGKKGYKNLDQNVWNCRVLLTYSRRKKERKKERKKKGNKKNKEERTEGKHAPKKIKNEIY